MLPAPAVSAQGTTLPMLSQQLLARQFADHILMPQSHPTLSIYNLEQGVYVLPKVSDTLLSDSILSYHAANCQSSDNEVRLS